jgi:transposase InsO family protein
VWWHRYQAEGLAGLEDRSSRPRRYPTRTKASRERRILWLRRNRGLGPARIAGLVRMPASTVHAVLVRHGLNRLGPPGPGHPGAHPAHGDGPPGRAGARGREEAGPHPQGRGLASTGPGLPRGPRPQGPVGYAFVHSAVDAHSRLAYSEVLADEQGATAAGFWLRAAAYFASMGIVVEGVLTDNGSCYRSRDFATALGDLRHSCTRPYRPATNGKVERFNRTLLAEWAYARPWSSDGQRTRALTALLHRYNHHRHHTAIGGPPISRVSNLAGHYT